VTRAEPRRVNCGTRAFRRRPLPFVAGRTYGRDVTQTSVADGVADALADARALAADLLKPAPGVAERLTNSVARPLADALEALGGEQLSAPPRSSSAPPAVGDRAAALARELTRLRTIADSPAPVIEAAAAAQDVALGLAPEASAAALHSELATLQSAVPAGIEVAPDGPYLVTNAAGVRTYLGGHIETPPQMALCRCGASSTKPFCDGTHAKIGFSGAKDPERVPDRRETHQGAEITVLDNRGICAHSGYCTDRLAAVFHASGEPFVTPDGAPPDAIIRAIRDCPSGALSFAINGREARDYVDQTRPPMIEVSLDGPYRVTGGLPLTDETGRSVERADGASLEHYSLCRCGQSQNKPFCSGRHWYVGFKDPPRAAAAEVQGEGGPDEEQAVELPGADEPVYFDAHIKRLFRASDRAAMTWTFDLWSYADVAANADAILQRVRAGSMPCDKAWPAERVEVFQRWVDAGTPESADGAASPPAPAEAADAPSQEPIGGRLGSLVKLRSDSPAGDRPLVIEHREPLIYMLCSAAELEHALMCEYLFAAFTLKRSVDEGLTEEQLAAVERWRSVLLLVAKQEMLHLAINCNLVNSLGASPHLSRPNLPQPAKHYPPGVILTLLPFGETALRHFIYLERPEGMDFDDAEGLAALDGAAPVMGEDEIAPHLQEFATVGHLYRSIEDGFRHIAATMGEENLFVAPASGQVRGDLFGWPQLRPVTSVADAMAAIETIVEQGEGPRGDWRNAHFGRFLKVLDEYVAMMEANPVLEVARPVLPALVRPPESGDEADLITDPRTAAIADLGNVAYEVLLQLLYRLLCHVDESDEQMKTLSDVAVGLMFDAIEPIGDILTTLPVGPEHPGRTAGPSFELFYQPDYLLPHREAAWRIMAEHLADAARLCNQHGPAEPRMVPVADALNRHAATLRANAR
jgi:CDGSH-type Zn-finger protein